MTTLPPSQDLGLFVERVALPPGWRVVYEPVVESTMDLAREAARRGWPDRSVFVSDYQTAGRGRKGRRWQAPPGLGLLFTVLLRLAGSPLEHTMLASVAVCEAAGRLLQLEPSIKWPNDLLLDGRKVAGVLAESHSGPNGAYTLVGCGLNVNQDIEDLRGLGGAATSLKLAAGRQAHRGELLVICLERLEAWLELDPDARSADLRQAWEGRLWARGRSAIVRDAGEEFSASVQGVAEDGALLVRLASGEVRRVLTGEIVV
jgi:BirA family transcriptional regulator, biotin operon repressor / biotin---[acetyl-CoA-carboxylase] ligase